jgi:hypothetical protein
LRPRSWLGLASLAAGALNAASDDLLNMTEKPVTQFGKTPAGRYGAASGCADKTLQLTWPALALRHAGPRSRKISATSKAGRDTRRVSRAAGPR